MSSIRDEEFTEQFNRVLLLLQESQNPCGEAPLEASIEPGSCSLPLEASTEPGICVLHLEDECFVEEEDDYSLKIISLLHDLDQLSRISRIFGPSPKEVYTAMVRCLRAQHRQVSQHVKELLKEVERSLQELPTNLPLAEEWAEAADIFWKTNELQICGVIPSSAEINDEKTYGVLMSEIKRLGGTIADEPKEDLSGQNTISAWQDWHDKKRV